MTYPTDRHYTSDHEWILLDGDTARVGITDYAAQALGDVVYLELPEVGRELTAGEACGEIESTKSVSDLVAPATGVVLEHNRAAVDAPETVNAAPHGDGWLYTMRVTDLPSDLLDATAYETLATGQGA